MVKKINLQKIKFWFLALMMLSAMSINTFSAPKETKKLEWKQISLEPDLDGDGIISLNSLINLPLLSNSSSG